MESLLLAQVAGAPDAAVMAQMKEWAALLLEKYAPLRAALGAEHPAASVAAGALDEDLLNEARALLLASLE